MPALEQQELDAEVGKLDGWEVRDGALQKEFACGDFNGSMAFVNKVAGAADAADHHPDVAISWDTVTLRWVTHNEGGITSSDVKMARKSDELAGS
jgi:4a-hydroxytetrahydrobiopterin dehydratase